MTNIVITQSGGVRSWIVALDRVLRGEATHPSALQDGTIKIPVGGLSLVLLVLSASYGFCMGSFALFDRPGGPSFAQLAAGTVKFPLLFLLTLLVTLPSLYVFNALVGSRLTVGSLVRLMVAALGVTLAVVASFGPIMAFFSVTTTNYPFIVTLNVFLCAISGSLGLTFLVRTLHRLSLASPIAITPPPLPPGIIDRPAADERADAGPKGIRLDGGGRISAAPAALPGATGATGALEPLRGQSPDASVRLIFRCWVLFFAVVGGQMSWVLRPFIGAPGRPFELFRDRQGDFFSGVWHLVNTLLR